MIDLLLVAGDHTVVPAAVAEEVAQRGADDAAVQALRLREWFLVVEDVPIPAELQASGLGAGESAAIAWALAHPGTEAILDDRAARRFAATLGVPLRGTLSLIVEAKNRGLIGQARPIVERVRQAGLYLSDHLVDESLRLVGE